MAAAIGCSLGCSAAAASRSSSASLFRVGSSAATAMTCGRPAVSVPVLSNATVSVRPSCSMTTADLTSTPFRPAVAIADSNGGMVASTTAQGDATIMKVIARSRVGCRAVPIRRGTAKRATVAATMPTE